MKIVQSYWSKPSSKVSDLSPNDRNLGGWLHKKYNYMSWTLSCLQISKFYPEIELVTDDLGFELLVEKLELPYTKVKVELDRLNEYHSDLWALGKMYAYSIQEEPFIHVDGDVFIWQVLPDKIENSELCVQNLETDEPGYQHVYKYIFQNFEYIPKILDNKGNPEISSVNAGIIGGHDISFFKEYTSLAFEFVNRNTDNLAGMDIGSFNMFYEQYLFTCLAKEKQKKINYLVDDQRRLLDKHANFAGLPLHTNYIHTVGTFKKRTETGPLLEYTLKNLYPEQYYKIINLLAQHSI